MNQLSSTLLELLSGHHLSDKQHEAFLLLSMDENQWPHVAMISVGEIVAIDATELRLSLWRNTVTTSNLVRTKKGTFVVFFGGVANYVKMLVEELPENTAAKHDRQCFVAKVESVRTDVAKYADIVSGVRIRLKEPEPVIQRWEETVEDMLK